MSGQTQPFSLLVVTPSYTTAGPTHHPKSDQLPLSGPIGMVGDSVNCLDVRFTCASIGTQLDLNGRLGSGAKLYRTTEDAPALAMRGQLLSDWTLAIVQSLPFTCVSSASR
jgi:hypothetical protein